MKTMTAPPRKQPANQNRGSTAAMGVTNNVTPSVTSVKNTSPPPPPKTIHHHRLQLLVMHLIPPLLLTAGLTIFTQSFFLSRTSFDHRSSCHDGSAGNLLQSALGLKEEDVEFLRRGGFLSDHYLGSYNGNNNNNNLHHNMGAGCWVPRRVDSMAILVVDALRFDFARDHLPLSVGSRLFPSGEKNPLERKNNATFESNSSISSRRDRGISKLYRFVADPPTVTMQRLKGLTTGGLPTFADISGSFGGASIDEDSWVEQLKEVPWDRRHHQRSTTKKITTTGGDGMKKKKPQLAFVGDDTWVDLFPTQFDDCHPFPSFNTRDLDTVDNGCLEHLPRLLDGLVGLKKEHDDEMLSAKSQTSENSTSFELIVAHFLGVDHVGHTYGPNNPHMEGKLHQMDVMLSSTLDRIDDAPADSCIVALVLGDHGMTEDRNHGGGTEEEVNAGLFVHFSPGCDATDENDDDEATKADGVIKGEEIPGSARAFDSIHQIDLVPTISFLLGLPVPYANIGGLVPDLLPAPRGSSSSASSHSTPHAAVALALNAAQVWNYLHTYSQTSRDLPKDRMKELKDSLDGAAIVYRDAISHSRKIRTESFKKGETNDISSEGEDLFFDSSSYRQACGLFKLFLAESTDLGKRVWTQFNERGMMIGIGIMAVAWIVAVPLWKGNTRNDIVRTLFRRAWSADNDAPYLAHLDGKNQGNNGIIKENIKGYNDELRLPLSLQASTLWSFRRLEVVAALLFMIFQCGVLTFSNSYIDHEREIVMFFLSILCLLVFRRWYVAASDTQHAPTYAGNGALCLPLIVALCSRMNDVLVTGHGLDPSLRLHAAHHPIVFLSSLFLLTLLRMRWLSPSSNNLETLIDMVATICLAASWWEKRSLDQSRNGFIAARFAMAAVFVGMAYSLYSLARQWKTSSVSGSRNHGETWAGYAQLCLFRAMLFLVIVTGPSAASTAVLIVIQCSALRWMSESIVVDAPVSAAIWRLAIRQVFFATNHHCSFNRLQFSAAFVASETFQFYLAGTSLFMNTFGWEILGSTLVLIYSRAGRSTISKNNGSSGRNVWVWFRYFQWTEMLASCLSVSVMKRHLMVWAIFAPRFMFAAVFTVICLSLWVLDVLLDFVAPFITNIHKSKQQIS